MSLFNSAFEAEGSSGPSTSLYKVTFNKSSRYKPGTEHKPSPKATKSRHSHREDSQKVRSIQDNMQRLLNMADKGRLKEKSDDSRPMGMQPRKKKRKRDIVSEDTAHLPAASLATKTERQMIKHKPNGHHASAVDKTRGETTTSHRDKDKRKPDKLEPKGVGFVQTEENAKADQSGLTKMQAGMQKKLEEARFRWLNERLYSTSSAEAVAMMKKDPQVFSDYHATHRLLTAGWPSPPLPYIIDKLAPLPKGTVIADLGCGDAGLARALVPQGKTVLSFDLVGDYNDDHGGWVVETDFLEHVPLPGRTGRGESEDEVDEGGGGASQVVDIVVCCLSLMGTNWLGGVYEACRILRQGGTLHIAEVTSRFINMDAFVTAVESFGFKLRAQTSPSTHFVLFEFNKTNPWPAGAHPGQDGWLARLDEGPKILRGCVYKKR